MNENRPRRIDVARPGSGRAILALGAQAPREQIPAGLPTDSGDDIEALCRAIAAIITRAARDVEATQDGTVEFETTGTVRGEDI